jgi:uncharacterized protein
MNAQEKQVIDEIFSRLKNVADQPRDAEVEKYIATLISQQPYAPYALAQSVYVQEQALLNAHQEIEALRAENARIAAQPQQGGGFLSSLFGGGQAQGRGAVPSYGQRQPSAPAYGQQGMQPQPASPWGQPQQQRGGMGFLGTAAAAAAGVAGGVIIGNMLSSAFGGGQAHAADGGAASPTNFFDGTAPQKEPAPDTQTYGSTEDYGSSGSDFGGGDFGGGDY